MTTASTERRLNRTSEHVAEIKKIIEESDREVEQLKSRPWYVKLWDKITGP